MNENENLLWGKWKGTGVSEHQRSRLLIQHRLEERKKKEYVAKTEHSHPLGMVVSTHFRCGKGVKRGLKNGALPFNID